jgi:hypothetical protein
MKLRIVFVLLLTQIFTLSAAQRDWKPGAFTLLDPTERKPAHTAVLIMIPPDMLPSYIQNTYGNNILMFTPM